METTKQTIRFGPAGGGKEFFHAGYKKSFEAPAWLHNLNLDAYEYQATRGVKISNQLMELFKKEALKYDIQCSLHAPYFINLVSKDKFINSKNYILESMKAAQCIGAIKVVFHPGWYGNLNSKDSLENVYSALNQILDDANKQNLDNIILAPETAGKKTQFGNLDEILTLCKKLPQNIIPTIDFGHLHARELVENKYSKGLVDKESYYKIFDKLEENLPAKIIQELHIHFSIVEHNKGGEWKHHTLEQEQEIGPFFDPLSEIIFEKNLTPTIICESKDKMASDAIILKKRFVNIKK